MYTLKRGSKTVGFYHQSKPSIISFKNIVHARAVHYGLHPNPKFTLIESLTPVIDQDVIAHMRSTLFIPKAEGDTLHPMHDGGYHLHQTTVNEIYTLPHTGIGIILPYELLDEDRYEFVFKAHIISRTT